MSKKTILISSISTFVFLVAIFTFIQVFVVPKAKASPMCTVNDDVTITGKATIEGGSTIKGGGGSYINFAAGSPSTYIGDSANTTYIDGTVNLRTYADQIRIRQLSGRNTGSFGSVQGDHGKLGGCTASNAGEIGISYNSNKSTDSLCFCGRYEGSYEWMCLVW